MVKAAIAGGHKVALAAKFSIHEDMLRKLGVTTFHWGLVRGSLNPLGEMASILTLSHIIKSFQPDLVHAVAQKPSII